MVDEVQRVTRAVSDILGLAEKFWDRVRTVEPQTSSLKIRCPERTADYAFAFNPSTLQRKVMPILKIEIPTITGLEVMSLSTLRKQPQAVAKISNGFALLLDKLPDDDKGFLATAEFLVQDPEAIRLLVDRKSKADRVGEGDVDEYWLHAQLKYPKALVWPYSDVEVRELDVDVDVGIYEALKLALPTRATQSMEALRNLITERNPREVWRRALQYTRVARGSEAEYIRRLQEIRSIVSTDEFRKFVDVTDDFKYSQTLPSVLTTDSAGLLGIPKFAKVVARTNLSLDDPTAAGTLVYKAREFREKALDVFGKKPDQSRRKARRKKKQHE